INAICDRRKITRYGSKVMFHPILPEKREVAQAIVGKADNLARFIDPVRRSESQRRIQCTHVGQRSPIPKKRMIQLKSDTNSRRVQLADHLIVIIEGIREAGRSTETPEVYHFAVLPKEGVDLRQSSRSRFVTGTGESNHNA